MKSTDSIPEPLDCIAMKRRIQAQIVSETKGMNPQQRLAHYHRLAEESPFLSKRRAGKKTRSRNAD